MEDLSLYREKNMSDGTCEDRKTKKRPAYQDIPKTMRYAILFDWGSEGKSFVTYDDNKRVEFDTFGSAYVRAVARGYSAPFEVVGLFDPKDISVTAARNLTSSSLCP
jgi:hypothetical protein